MVGRRDVPAECRKFALLLEVDPCLINQCLINQGFINQGLQLSVSSPGYACDKTPELMPAPLMVNSKKLKKNRL